MNQDQLATARSDELNKELGKAVMKMFATTVAVSIGVGLLLKGIQKWGDGVPSINE